ncbi:hypothetical protein TRFO_07799 [Tritrichomonas foetus]|uniref:Uncharacterized protein n=1 Tax=Tritrichomonas foetus TaxID=1144522 RepID=A0A1J4JPX5_9EUKA|nr:hypothetical protein TRFO_07799 [Tritrichomonas foetus]|eukprot:OHT00810.1 hypothetical protein TRFO_07799 [Tritrichomonas foetus]
MIYPHKLVSHSRNQENKSPWEKIASEFDFSLTSELPMLEVMIKNSISLQFGVPSNHLALHHLVYHCISLKASDSPSIIQKFILQICNKILSLTNLNYTTTCGSVFEICPEMQSILSYLEELSISGDFNPQINKELFIFQLYEHAFQIYELFHGKFCFLKVASIDILTYSLVLLKNQEKECPKEYIPYDRILYIRDRDSFILKTISLLISNNKYMYAHETGINCLLRILQYKCDIPNLIDLIPLLINVAYSNVTLYKIYQCLGDLIDLAVDNEYLHDLIDFFKQQDYHDLLFKEYGPFFRMITKFIRTFQTLPPDIDWNNITFLAFEQFKDNPSEEKYAKIRINFIYYYLSYHVFHTLLPSSFSKLAREFEKKDYPSPEKFPFEQRYKTIIKAITSDWDQTQRNFGEIQKLFNNVLQKPEKPIVHPKKTFFIDKIDIYDIKDSNTEINFKIVSRLFFVGVLLQHINEPLQLIQSIITKETPQHLDNIFTWIFNQEPRPQLANIVLELIKRYTIFETPFDVYKSLINEYNNLCKQVNFNHPYKHIFNLEIASPNQKRINPVFDLDEDFKNTTPNKLIKQNEFVSSLSLFLAINEKYKKTSFFSSVDILFNRQYVKFDLIILVMCVIEGSSCEYGTFFRRENKWFFNGFSLNHYQLNSDEANELTSKGTFNFILPLIESKIPNKYHHSIRRCFMIYENMSFLQNRNI